LEDRDDGAAISERVSVRGVDELVTFVGVNDVGATSTVVVVAYRVLGVIINGGVVDCVVFEGNMTVIVRVRTD
jgi:hypothetical protein